MLVITKRTARATSFILAVLFVIVLGGCWKTPPTVGKENSVECFVLRSRKSLIYLCSTDSVKELL